MNLDTLARFHAEQVHASLASVQLFPIDRIVTNRNSRRVVVAVAWTAIAAAAVVAAVLVAGPRTGVTPTTLPPVGGVSTTTTPTTTPTTTTLNPGPGVIDPTLLIDPRVGQPGESLIVCGTLKGTSEVHVVLSDPESGEVWPDEIHETAFVIPDEAGRWCWTGTIPTELQTTDPRVVPPTRRPITPGTYEIRVESFGDIIAYDSLQVVAPDALPQGPPSQSEADAARDGILPELAAVPVDLRVQVGMQVESTEGLWVLSRPSGELGGWIGGCASTDPQCLYGRDAIALSEYGEVLLMDPTGQQIVRAYPLPGLPPRSLVVTDEAVYCGRQGDGGLPDSMLCRIDRESGEWMVRVFPFAFESAYNPLPTDIYIPDNWVINDPIDRVLFEELTITADGLVVIGYEDQSRFDPTTLQLLD